MTAFGTKFSGFSVSHGFSVSFRQVQAHPLNVLALSSIILAKCENPTTTVGHGQLGHFHGVFHQ